MCGFTITKTQIPNLLKHRGKEVYEHKQGDWFLCFNSLPISSNNTGIFQPLVFKDFSIMFNGEIFNYKELNQRSKSDLHYLSELFIKIKNDPIKLYEESLEWDGFWAISIITDDSVYCFTDPIGKKQLYYSRNGIASEIKPLLQNSDYDYFEYSELNFGIHSTNFSTVKRFLPGYLYKYSIGANMPYKVMGQKYFNRDVKMDLYNAIDISVKERLENKIDGVSLLLSGGLDSNIVLHHAMKYTKEIDIVSFESEESELVKDICDSNGLEVKFIKPVEDEIKNAVFAYEHSLDYGSLLANYLLFKNCSNYIVLSGDGADELFSGYKRAIKENTWQFDVMSELPYYHNIRLDRTSMAHTKESRCPLMSYRLINIAKRIPHEQRKNKQCLRATYKSILDDVIINGIKKPLRYMNEKNYNLLLTKNMHENIWKIKSNNLITN